jgi:ElaB/YqjD/DUF883 family membrane-anchored ribosome-binding protein
MKNWIKECIMETNNNESLSPGRVTSPYQSNPRSGNSTLDNIKTTVADKLKSAAQTLSEKSGQNSTVSQYAGQASSWLNNAADYVREIQPDQVKTDIQKQVRTNPGRSLLIAGVAGLVLGTLFRRR